MTVPVGHRRPERGRPREADTSDVIAIERVGHHRRRALESMVTLSDGYAGWRGLGESCDSPATPATRVAGVFDDRAVSDFLPGPICASVDLRPDSGWSESIELDLATATLVSVFERRGAKVSVTKFAPVTRPGVLVLRADGPVSAVGATGPIRPPDGDLDGLSVEIVGDAITVSGTEQAIAAVAEQTIVDHAGRRCLTRIAAVAGGDRHGPLRERAQSRVDGSVGDGYERLWTEHCRAWLEKWGPTRTEIEGDRSIEQGVRLAQFHLLSAAHVGGESTIGARGLTGSAYRGHVFWDTDVFVVPALCGMDPSAARSALMYRWNRLVAARRRAATEGRAGARFPWESARTGDEQTPAEATDLNGRVIPILSGRIEEHIVADIAWAVCTYQLWTDDRAFMRLAGDEILTETARYWMSRIEADSDGAYHLRAVVGPDEYHEWVDDNVFTNTMAAYNLRQAARPTMRSPGVSGEERESWLHAADRIHAGFDPSTGLHEQFDGYFDLQPLMASDVAVPPFSADVILGHDGVQRTQIIKQADVMMLHHLIPDEMPPGSLESDLEFYLPRTSHGSSLSPAIHAGLLARAGRGDDAVELLRLAARLDLDDLTGTTAGGVHLATMGGLWQAVTFGLCGVRPRADGIMFDPNVPEALGAIVHRFRCRHTSVEVTIDGERATWRSDADLTILPSGDAPIVGHRFDFVRSSSGWRVR